VRRALDDGRAEHPNELLAFLVEAKATELRDDPALAQWALTLPWPRFCAVVRIVTGKTREELFRE
jgi:hypothetical protein